MNIVCVNSSFKRDILGHSCKVFKYFLNQTFGKYFKFCIGYIICILKPNIFQNTTKLFLISYIYFYFIHNMFSLINGREMFINT